VKSLKEKRDFLQEKLYLAVFGLHSAGYNNTEISEMIETTRVNVKEWIDKGRNIDRKKRREKRSTALVVRKEYNQLKRELELLRKQYTIVCLQLELARVGIPPY
jgi:hypothetical protein